MLADDLFGPVKQWGYLVKDLDQAMQAWVEQLGVGPFWGFRNVSLKSHFNGVESEVIMDVGLAYQNGVQIELIQQRNVDNIHSPYSAFYATDLAQTFQQVAYHSYDIEAGRAIAKTAGLDELGYVESTTGDRYYYYSSEQLNGLIVELMQVDEMLVGAFDACAQQAENWQGEDPYRLISI